MSDELDYVSCRHLVEVARYEWPEDSIGFGVGADSELVVTLCPACVRFIVMYLADSGHIQERLLLDEINEKGYATR